MLSLTSILFGVSGISSGIENDNETGITSNILGSSLSLYGTIISKLNCSTSIPITKVLFLVIIESSIFCRNGS